MNDPVDLTRELLVIPSPTGREHEVTAFLADRLRALGWTVILQPVRDGRENIFAHRGNPVVVFSTHLDTVPPELPFREDQDSLHGRGACDAKGIAAAMISAGEQMASAGETRIGLLFVVGEENGSDGAKAAATLTPRGQFVVNGEPTENRLVTAQKGSLRVTLNATGRAAHSGYPELGDSAIDKLLAALERIRTIKLPVDPLLGASTLNIGRIVGGEAPNVVAPSASAELLLRLVGPSQPLRDAIETAVGGAVSATFGLEIPTMLAPALSGWPSTTVSFASDLPFLGAWGRGYQMGPGSIHVAHTDHEHITKHDLRKGAELYQRVAASLLAEAIP